MPRFTFNPLFAFILALLFSISAGFLYADYGWHNGLMFLLIGIDIGLLTYTLREYQGVEAVTRFMPMLINVAVILVVSVFSGFAGISLGNGSWDATSLAAYAVSVVAFGFVAVSVSVYNAVTYDDARFVGPLITSLIVYAIVIIFGLVAIADDAGSQLIVAAGYAVFSLVVGFFFMWRSSGKVMY